MDRTELAAVVVAGLRRRRVQHLVFGLVFVGVLGIGWILWPGHRLSLLLSWLGVAGFLAYFAITH